MLHSLTDHPIYVSVPVEKITERDNDCYTSGIIIEENDRLTDEDNLSQMTEVLRYLRENNYTKTVITVGGVLEPKDALQLFAKGTDLIMLSGGYVSSGPGLTKRIKEAQLDER